MRTTMQLAYGTKRWVLAGILSVLPAVSAAVPFSTDVSISATVEMDPFSLEPFLGTQTGTLSHTSGGVTTNTTINGITPTGSNPLGGALTDIGDGVAIDYHVIGPAFESTEFYGNYNFNFSNTSLTDTYVVTLGFVSNNVASAVGVDGFVESQMLLQSIAETLFSTYRLVDLFFGDNIDNSSNGSFLTYDLTLNPGDTVTLTGVHDILGSSFDPDTTYAADLLANVSVVDVVNLTVPVPPVAMLFAVGALMLAPMRRRRQGASMLQPGT